MVRVKKGYLSWPVALEYEDPLLLILIPYSCLRRGGISDEQNTTSDAVRLKSWLLINLNTGSLQLFPFQLC